ncbi:tail fiber protein [Leptothoe sp. LEGE 181152]|nr:tail fiber protein [Leptothoe sp. LEGE 181152]
MSEPFLGEIKMFGFNFPPRGWAKCDGETLAINQNQSLYSLLGTTYGGDGRTSFALPGLRGRVPIGFGSGYPQGQRSGEEGSTLTTSDMPSHTHTVQATSADASGTTPSDQVLAHTANVNIYADAANLVSLNSNTVGSAGGGQAIDNMQPFLAVEFCIALTGTFPPRN